MTETEPRVTAWPRWMSIPRAIWILALLLAFPLPFLVRAWFLSHVPDIGDPFDVAEFCKSHDPLPENDAIRCYSRASWLYFTEYHDKFSRGVQSVRTLDVSRPNAEAYGSVLDQGWGVADDYVKE